MNADVIVENKLGNLCLIDLDGEIIVEPEEHFDTIYYPSLTELIRLSLSQFMIWVLSASLG